MSAVKLVAITPDAEQLIIDCARVSNPTNQGKEGKGLIEYLIRNDHWSPFEMANMVVSIETSRAISAQIIRHRSFSFQEFSQRYAAIPGNEVYEARRQDEKNRQNSIDDLSDADKKWFLQHQIMMFDGAARIYRQALARGIAKEQARFLLPMSSTTSLYMNGTIRSWIHYLELRCGNGTQKEHMDIAKAIRDIFAEQLPMIHKAVWGL